ncbi:AAA family ATPase [Streptomyces millisiae]|uniref:ATP-binding protein n=1 Tax=Streptomyces millisiae TaxID=3075542 RepID=A0ABU2LXQ2_9ACTN|nr:AAA family ATPase [Streptomyces sp. DSM 44918]MDT0322334.1 ATP-binding protein [Streptomyces sp. DSM 44918]
MLRQGTSGPEGGPAGGTPVIDLRGPAAARAAPAPPWRPGDRVVVSGLPGSGKSTLMSRVAAPAGGRLVLVDSQHERERWAARLPRWLPYGVYRPAVRIAHYVRLWRALRSPAGVLVHDCGRNAFVRRWLARDARRRARGFHLLLLDVPAEAALAGQLARGRAVSVPAFGRHRRAVARLIAEVEAGTLPPGCASATLLDRASVSRLDRRWLVRPPSPAAAERI